MLGSPISHSLSPVLHGAAYAALGLPDWAYSAVECDETALPQTLQRVEADGLAGVSLTMPLKRAVLPLLTRTDRLVADVGAANTVLFGGITGDWYGANTDVPGMVTALNGSSPDVDLSTLCILGGGATAASALAAARELGVSSCVVCVRRPSASRYLEEVAARVDVPVAVRPWSDAAVVAADVDVVVATTPAGATDELAPSVRARAGAVLFDVVYTPWPTALASAWSAAGGRVIGGLELLVEQAALQVQLMTGKQPPVDVMRAAGMAALSGR